MTTFDVAVASNKKKSWKTKLTKMSNSTAEDKAKVRLRTKKGRNDDSSGKGSGHCMLSYATKVRSKQCFQDSECIAWDARNKPNQFPAKKRPCTKDNNVGSSTIMFSNPANRSICVRYKLKRHLSGRRSMLRGAIYILTILLIWLANVTESAEKTEDLYKLLGVSRTATTKEIKQAYRRKALDTHPDKNTEVPKEEAAEAFQKVVHAFEVLSDEGSRKQYDRTGRTAGATSTNRGSGGGTSWSFGGGGFRWTYRTHHVKKKMKDRFDVQEAMSRVIHVVSLEQLKTIILDDAGEVLERNLLICFVTPKLEKHVNDEMVYPFPFAAKSAQGLWWEDMLQTSMVRYHRGNELTRFFGVPDGDSLDKPLFLFGKRGEPLSSSFQRLSTNRREVFEDWTWKRMQVSVEFVNRHIHPVEIYWINGRTGKVAVKLDAGESEDHTTILSHEWFVRDARTDTRPDSPHRRNLSDNTKLAHWKITSDEEGQKLIIEAKACYDLSGHCNFWRSQGECRKNEMFMKEDCRKTCKFCTDDEDEELRRELRKGPNACYDISFVCGKWRDEGECQNNVKYMTEQCPRTCNFCKAGDNEEPADQGRDEL